jgi:hypothetical protein
MQSYFHCENFAIPDNFMRIFANQIFINFFIGYV